MADDLEKTEEPTPKKLEDARKEGNVAKSQELKRAAKFTFSAAPIVDPKKKLYGATLTLHF